MIPFRLRSVVSFRLANYQHSPRLVIHLSSVASNPDSSDPLLQSENGIYKPNCGLDNVMLSWGHDEYLYGVMKKQSRRECFGSLFFSWSFVFLVCEVARNLFDFWRGRIRKLD